MAKRKKSTIYGAMMRRISRMGVSECEIYARSEPAIANELVRRLKVERRELLDNGVPKADADRVTQEAWLKGIRNHWEAFAMDFYFRRCSPQLIGILTRRENVAGRSMAVRRISGS